MLWYKSLREIAAVALTGTAALAVACLLIVLNQESMRAHTDPSLTYAGYIWKSVYKTIGRDIFIMLSVILGSGGLLQERAQGTLGFTLSLPVSRRRIVLTRAIAGYAGLLAIAAAPVVVLPIASPYAGQTYAVEQAVGFFLLWAGCGAVCYGFTFLLAHRFEGQYTPVLVAVPSLMAYGVVLNLPWLSRQPMLNIFEVMNGEAMPFFDMARHVLVGPLPGFTLIVMLAISAIFIVWAAQRMQPLDF
ncbi:MAG: ABC transporter permease subunit [Bryobacterales bacterium]|nr:ABC transporter permease subunit [Bryobacterales bacterium]